MTSLDLFLLCCGFIGTVSAYLVGHSAGYDKGETAGRQAEAEDQINRRAKYGWTVFDKSRKTFPGMSEIRAVNLRERK